MVREVISVRPIWGPHGAGLESAVRPHAASAACGHFLKKCGRMKKSAASAVKISGKLFNFSYYMVVFDTFEEFFESSLVIRSRNFCWKNSDLHATILSWKILNLCFLGINQFWIQILCKVKKTFRTL